MSAFDKLVLNDDIPFAFLNDFFKVLRDFSPPLAFVNTNEDKENKIFLCMKVGTKKGYQKEDYDFNVKETDKDSEEDEYDYISLVKINDEIKIQIDIDVSKEKTIASTIEKIKSIFPDNVEIGDSKQIGVHGLFFVPRQSLHPIIFSHLILNDVAFSRTLAINESEKASKKKEGIYTYFNSGSEIMSTVITPKVVYAYDTSLRNQDRTLFVDGEPYVSIKISRATSVDVVQKFHTLMSKIFTIYNNAKAGIETIYNKYIPGFKNLYLPTVHKVSEKSRTFLNDIDPELFKTSYTRSCLNKPIIISQEDAKSGKYKAPLLYPKTPQEGEQRWYACEPGSNSHIGLKRNDPNSRYPFVPCCYEQDQRKDKTSFLNIYTNTPSDLIGGRYEDECIVTNETQQHKLVKTPKTTKYNGYGTITSFSGIKTVFDYSLLDYPDYIYTRRGMDRSRLSFFQCVFEAVGQTYKIGDDTCKNRLEYLRLMLEKIAENPKLLNCGKQCFNNVPLFQIARMLRDRDTYLDPKFFIPIFEEYFNCNIVVFTPREMLIPKHSQNYIKFSNNKNTVILIEHMGIKGENLIYPQCELIVRSNRDISSDFQVIYEKDDAIVQITEKLFDKMAGSYISDKCVSYYNLEPELEIIEQNFNFYGKVSQFVVMFERRPVFIYTKNPLPPMKIKEKLDQSVTNMDVAAAFLTQKFIVDKKNVISGGMIVAIEFTTTFGNTYFIITVPSPIGTNNFVESSENIFFPDILNHPLQTFIKNKKLGYSLSEYFKYLFSLYLHSKDITNVTNEHINHFIENCFEVDLNYAYENIPKTFSIEDNGFMRNEKLIVNSIELRDRLVYIIMRDKDSLMSYYTKTTLDGLFENILDLHQHPTQIILFGLNALKIFISNATRVHTLTDKILEIPQPYFFKNDLVNKTRVYLAKNAGGSSQYAQTIFANWDQYGFISDKPPSDRRYKASVFAYSTDVKIVQKVVGPDDRISILTTIDEDDDVYFTALVSV